MTDIRISPAAATCRSDALSALRAAYQLDEGKTATNLLANFPIAERDRAGIQKTAMDIVTCSRAMKEQQGSLDAFLAEFGLSNREGVALMCLAEALLRVPDVETQDKLIAEKLLSGDWDAHKGQSESIFVNASTWALMLTGGVLDLGKDITRNPNSWMKSLIARTGQPVIRAAVNQAMKIMGKQFVFGTTIEEGLVRQNKQTAAQQLMSFDMLGEGARTFDTARRYLGLYKEAIEAVGAASPTGARGPDQRSSVSIKLSALHPRYEETSSARMIAELLPRLKELALSAKIHGIQLTIDSEEAARLDISLQLFEKLAEDNDLAGWDGLGLAVQAYQKRAPYVIDWVVHLGRETGRKFAVRLVKGAYWDSEIKHAQELGLEHYPVFTRKVSTDVSYLYTAARMLDAQDVIYPQFATHNAHTIAAIARMADGKNYEFQRLHGMGDLLYKAAEKTLGQSLSARIYAPVGLHEDLLPYLVRRLLENGANSSFINRFMDIDVPVEDAASDPVTVLEAAPALAHTLIPRPPELYGAARLNSRGFNLMNRVESEPIIAGLKARTAQNYEASCLVGGKNTGGNPIEIRSPTDRNIVVGSAREAQPQDIEDACMQAAASQHGWNKLGGCKRAQTLRKTSELIEDNRDTFIDLLVREAGKTIADGIAEIREAVDFCRYYADMADKQFESPIVLPGPTGERNELYLGGRGSFLCIAPWNFPLAIFVGQVAAALAAGNAVIAKPAEQTPIVAWFAVKLFHSAGIPVDVLHLLLGSGLNVGAALVEDRRISGVAFTGSTTTAKLINRTLAERDGAIVPLIAETGGQNCMFVDSTALPEQVVDDVILSAFGSAGQRCSALRVLFLQNSIADKVIDMLKGALRERTVGDPALLTTDIGPVIDAAALARLTAHCARMEKHAKPIAAATLAAGTEAGTFFAPRIFEIEHLSMLEGEVFGPILHIIRFSADTIEDILEQIAATGYGLTFGVHSRLEGRWEHLFDKTRIGNSYINRNMIGAVVGVQPFGGEGLSGTGPKAGGPNYLLRFASERALTINTAAVGGNTELFSMEEGK